MFGRHRDVFGVTADNPWSEYAKALFDILGIVIKLAWAGDNIDGVKVHCKPRAVDGFNQAGIDFGAIGQEIRLGFDDQFGGGGLDAVKDGLDGRDRLIKTLFGHVERIGITPIAGFDRATMHDTATGAHFVGIFKPATDFVNVFLA